MSYETSRGLFEEEEEEEMKKKIINYLQEGKKLDKTCPGCNKTMAKLRNLISHLKASVWVYKTLKPGELKVLSL